MPLFASNEPITLSGSRAQRVLHRRINQSFAEYEVLNTLEQSWGGLCTHVRDGWNVGAPPYWYRAKLHRHPNPGRGWNRMGSGARRSLRSRCGATTRTLGYGTIAERLSADPTKYPPPVPPGGKRARGAWSKSSVSELLKNPKYTGYQGVQPTCVPLGEREGQRPRQVGVVTLPGARAAHPEMDVRRTHRTAGRETRVAGRQQAQHPPQTQRTYVLRGMVVHGCGRRMYGNLRHHTTYYSCNPSSNNRGRPDKTRGHAKAAYIPEPAVLDAVSAFNTDRVFGPDRRDLLEADLATVDDRETRQRETERDRLQRTLADLDKTDQAAPARPPPTTRGCSTRYLTFG